MGEIDFGSGDYSNIWVEMANIMKPTDQTGFDFYLDDMLLEPKTDFKIAQELPHLDSYESNAKPSLVPFTPSSVKDTEFLGS